MPLFLRKSGASEEAFAILFLLNNVKINIFPMDNQMIISQMNGSILPLVFLVITLIIIYNVRRKNQSEQ